MGTADKQKTISFEELQAIRAACLKNAEDLTSSAKTLLNSGVYHICYHLAVLALEEVGKASLMQSKFHLDKFKDDEEVFDPDTEDHVKKIFWAIWGMTINLGKVSKEEIESNRGLAKLIHENRLKYLYTDPYDPNLPQDKLDRREAEKIISLAESRLGFENCFNLVEPDGPIQEDIKWFLMASNKSELRHLLFSEESFDKLAEVGTSHEWIRWLREEDNRFTQEARKRLEDELSRIIPPLTGIGEPKWKIKLSIRSESHSIRSSYVTQWNSFGTGIQVGKTNDHNELTVQIILPSAISIQDVYDKGWTYSKIFVMGLNIGTNGFFWWHVPRDTDEYFDEIKDIESGERLKFERNPKLKVDWERETLKADSILGIWRVMHYLAKINGTPETQALDLYFGGLALIGKTDIHLQFETNAFERFYLALKVAMYLNGDWDGTEDLKTAFLRYLVNNKLNMEAEDDIEKLDQHLQWGLEIEKNRVGNPSISLNDVIGMKSLCNIYLMLRVMKLVPFPPQQEGVE